MADLPPFSPVVSLLALARSWETELGEALKALGTSTRRFGLLGHISGSPGISFSELARRSGITVQSAHSAVESLLKDGVVTDGTASAGAASRLQTTPAGEELLGRCRDEVRRLDGVFAAEHPELAEALRVTMQRKLGRPL